MSVEMEERGGARRRGRLVALLALLAAGCLATLPPALDEAPRSAVATTAGPNQSMIHVARVEGGVVVIDLGWWGAEEALDEALDEIGAGRDAVIAVFLTHAHRDHVGAWRALRHAPFHMAEPEVDLFFGRSRPRGPIPSLADRIRSRDLPAPEEVEVRAFSSDTIFPFGADTVRAYPVPGHTPGSTAYLFRGTLFAGDAVAWTPLLGFRPARWVYSDDVGEATRSLHSLRWRLRAREVLHVCTAHAECVEFTEEFWEDVLGEPPR